MSIPTNVLAWLTMLIIVLAAHWCAVNTVAIWPTIETTQMHIAIAADTGTKSDADSGVVKTSNAEMPMRDSTIVRRRWTGGGELWMSPVTLAPPLTADVRVLLLALFSGALGAAIHVFMSLSGFVGNATFKSGWIMWYVLRLPTGALLGLFITMALHGGISPEHGSFDGSNPFQICCVAGVAGLFSRSALDKLEDVFETLFTSTRNEERADNMKPTDTTTDMGERQ